MFAYVIAGVSNIFGTFCAVHDLQWLMSECRGLREHQRWHACSPRFDDIHLRNERQNELVSRVTLDIYVHVTTCSPFRPRKLTVIVKLAVRCKTWSSTIFRCVTSENLCRRVWRTQKCKSPFLGFPSLIYPNGRTVFVCRFSRIDFWDDVSQCSGCVDVYAGLRGLRRRMFVLFPASEFLPVVVSAYNTHIRDDKL